MMDGEATRRRLLAAIAHEPGINTSALCRMVGLSWSTVNRHLRILDRRGLVALEHTGWERNVYPADIPATDRRWLRALFDQDAGQLLRVLLQDPDRGARDLSESLGWSRKVIHRHLSRLIDDGLVERRGQVRPRYRPLAAPATVMPFADRQAAVPAASPDAAAVPDFDMYA